MVISKGKAVLLIRYNNFNNTDFIEEHNNAVDHDGCVWMLKAGRRLVEKKLQKVIDESGILVLKAPKSVGGKYYCTKIYDSFFGSPNEKMNYPVYYEQLIEDEKLWQIESLYGSWLHIGSIIEMPESELRFLKLISNNKRVEDVLGSTMSSTLYIQSEKDIVL